MRFLMFVVGSLIAATALAAPVRFKGSGVADTNSSYTPRDFGGRITFDGSYAADISLPIRNPIWDLDISTDGQSVTIHDMTVRYSGMLTINPLVWLDLNIQAKITNLTVDINPSTTTVWTVQEHSFSSMSVSGIYHGIGLTQAFSGSLPDQSTTTYEKGLLDFANWSNELKWNASFASSTTPPTSRSSEYRVFSAPSSAGWIGVEPYLHIREIQVWEPISVTLTPYVESANFNGDAIVDGADFLLWQRNEGVTGGATLGQGDANGSGSVDAADCDIWRAQFGLVVGAPVGQPVPEPAAFSLVPLALVGVSMFRRQPR